MGGSVNRVIIIGNLGADPDVRTTPSGQMVATLSIATSESYTDKSGAKQEKTEWHRVQLWGKQAELAQRYLTKGRKVYIEGRLTYRSWDDKETGQKRYSTEIVASQMVFIDSGGGGESRNSGSGSERGAGYQSGSVAYGQGNAGGGYGGGGRATSGQSGGGGGGFGGPDDDYYKSDVPF